MVPELAGACGGTLHCSVALRLARSRVMEEGVARRLPVQVAAATAPSMGADRPAPRRRASGVAQRAMAHAAPDAEYIFGGASVRLSDLDAKSLRSVPEASVIAVKAPEVLAQAHGGCQVQGVE